MTAQIIGQTTPPCQGSKNDSVKLKGGVLTYGTLGSEVEGGSSSGWLQASRIMSVSFLAVGVREALVPAEH